ncbi:unnamed protein product [Orchesella dallaii]|uniref:Uncharacterized protein n=1 Tax=Orchesella dallaii TaxID=48710 RepID=A0ABP1QTH5_9HEXA
MPCLKFTSFIGWINGIFLLDSPWGIPRFTSWLSPSALISLVNLIIISFLVTDMFINYSDIIERTEIQRLGVYISKISSTHRMLFYFVLRFTFLFKAKRLGKFLNQLYFYPTKNGSVLKRNLSKFDTLLIIISYTCTLVVSIQSTFLISTTFTIGDSVLKPLGSTVYGLVLGFFGILPVGLSDTIAFAIIIAIIRGILRIFKEFCKDIENVFGQPVDIKYKVNWPSSKIDAGRFIDLKMEFEKSTNILSEKGAFKIHPNFLASKDIDLPYTREEIIAKFHEMTNIFEIAGKVVSPFVFIILVVTTVELVATVSTIFVIGHQGIFLLTDVVVLIKVAIHLCLLQVGYGVQVTVQYKSFILLFFFQ